MSGYVKVPIWYLTAGTYFYLILDIPGRYIPKVLSLPTVPGAACCGTRAAAGCYAVSGHAPFEFRSKYYFK